MRPMVYVNGIGMLMLLVLVVCNSTSNSSNNRRKRAFNLLALSNVFYLLVDNLTYLFEGNISNTGLLYFLNFLDFTGGMVIAFAFVNYMTVMLQEKGSGSKKDLKTFGIWGGLLILLMLIVTISGGMFTIENGYYVAGKFYFLVEFISMMPMILLFMMIYNHTSIFGRYESTAMFIYLTFPLVGMALEYFYDDSTFVFIASSFSILVVYSMLQNNQIAEARVREQLTKEFARKDMLTGLMNRSAFNEDVYNAKLKGNGAVIYCDCNRLKYTNDTRGHDAGDELLKKMARILIKHFGKSNTYRISGDEFVAILRGHDEKYSLRLVDFMMADCDENDHIASVGVAYGDLGNYDDLENRAEEMMYANKRKLHESFMPDFVDERVPEA